MFAVREEVDVLKEKIVELLERIQVLERENEVLKGHVPTEVLATIALPTQTVGQILTFGQAVSMMAQNGQQSVVIAAPTPSAPATISTSIPAAQIQSSFPTESNVATPETAVPVTVPVVSSTTNAAPDQSSAL